MTLELKPCPFCGNAIIRDYHVRDGRAVHCVKCGASMTAFNPDALKEAAKAWNTRAETAENIALREQKARLVEALFKAANRLSWCAGLIHVDTARDTAFGYADDARAALAEIEKEAKE